MTEMIGTSAGSETLGRFLYDFRRALLRHRKSRMALLFHVRFPEADQGDFAGEFSVEKLDFQIWLTAAPPPEVRDNLIYQQLLEIQASFMDAAGMAVTANGQAVLNPEKYAEMLHLMLRLDVLADRVTSGISATMTDLDPLTGLSNRAAMERDLAHALETARSSGRGFALAMVDADHFKRVNDDHGHAFGDLVLQTLTERFVESLRPRDQVYRYGGEEFLLFLPETTLEQTLPVLERLRQRAAAQPIRGNGISVTVTVSIGAAAARLDDEVSATIEHADAALYRAKEAGRNRVEY